MVIQAYSPCRYQRASVMPAFAVDPITGGVRVFRHEIVAHGHPSSHQPLSMRSGPRSKVRGVPCTGRLPRTCKGCGGSTQPERTVQHRGDRGRVAGIVGAGAQRLATSAGDRRWGGAAATRSAPSRAVSISSRRARSLAACAGSGNSAALAAGCGTSCLPARTVCNPRRQCRMTDEQAARPLVPATARLGTIGCYGPESPAKVAGAGRLRTCFCATNSGRRGRWTAPATARSAAAAKCTTPCMAHPGAARLASAAGVAEDRAGLPRARPLRAGTYRELFTPGLFIGHAPHLPGWEKWSAPQAPLCITDLRWRRGLPRGAQAALDHRQLGSCGRCWPKRAKATAVCAALLPWRLPARRGAPPPLPPPNRYPPARDTVHCDASPFSAPAGITLDARRLYAQVFQPRVGRRRRTSIPRRSVAVSEDGPRCRSAGPGRSSCALAQACMTLTAIRAGPPSRSANAAHALAAAPNAICARRRCAAPGANRRCTWANCATNIPTKIAADAAPASAQLRSAAASAHARRGRTDRKLALIQDLRCNALTVYDRRSASSGSAPRCALTWASPKSMPARRSSLFRYRCRLRAPLAHPVGRATLTVPWYPRTARHRQVGVDPAIDDACILTSMYMVGRPRGLRT